MDVAGTILAATGSKRSDKDSGESSVAEVDAKRKEDDHATPAAITGRGD